MAKIDPAELQRINDEGAADLKRRLAEVRKPQIEAFNLAAEIQAEGVIRAAKRLAQQEDEETMKNLGKMSEVQWETWRRSKFGF
jgi:hypothetical protein